MSSMFSASSRKSSSSAMVSANSSTSAGGLASAATGIRPTRCGASQAITARSFARARPPSGRCTLTTTSLPSRRRAACTWAIEAAASGVGSNRREHARRAGGRARRFDDAVDHGQGLRRHPIAAHLNSATSSAREEPLSRGDDLSELDVRRAEPLGGHPQPAREAGHRDAAAPTPLRQVPRHERAPEVPHGGPEPAGRRRCASAGEPGERGSQTGPYPGDTRSPGQRLRVQDPGAVVAEDAQ